MLDRRDAPLERIGDALGAPGVGGRAAAGLAGLLDRRAHLVQRELGGVGIHARRHHAAGGEDLDDVGAGLDLFAHALAHLVGAVGLAADQMPAVAAGDADAAAGAQHPRPGHEAGAHGVAHAQLGVVAAAEIAHRGDAGLDRLPRAQHRLDDGGGERVLQQRGSGVGLGAEAEVDVTVDEPGQQRQPVESPDRPRRRLALADHGGDAPLLDDHRAAGHRRRPAAVDEHRPGQDRAIHRLTSSAVAAAARAPAQRSTPWCRGPWRPACRRGRPGRRSAWP